jgi:hypothetical protein
MDALVLVTMNVPDVLVALVVLDVQVLAKARARIVAGVIVTGAVKADVGLLVTMTVLAFVLLTALVVVELALEDAQAVVVQLHRRVV